MQSKYIFMILGMTLVTYIPRMLPVTLLSKVKLPDTIVSILKYVGPAILASLLAPALFITDGSLNISLSNNYLLAAIPTFFTAYFSRSIFTTVFLGMFYLYILTLI
ncbi:MAG: AzlD domain-containing protein [Halanaerobiales bacterium]|nr:AzlD domain-containing protein [Halanaerobiales bacterium]